MSLGELAGLPEPFAGIRMVDILAIGVMTGSSLTLIQSVFNSLAHTNLKPRVLVFKGLVPMLMSLSTVIILFSYTEWAW